MGKKSHQPEITVEELISTLKKTSLPTIVVEGLDDMIVYRTFEVNLLNYSVSVLPVGGREKVLKIFKRKNELPSNVQIVFIADQDVWINTAIPEEYQNERLIFTNGYSIENDVYIDGELWKLLRGSECGKYDAELNEFIDWYALALDRHLKNPEIKISLHPDHVLNNNQKALLLALNPDEVYPINMRANIRNDYRRLLRGKSLLALLMRNMNYAGREPRHSGGALIESVAVRPGNLLLDITNKVKSLIQN